LLVGYNLHQYYDLPFSDVVELVGGIGIYVKMHYIAVY